MLKGDAIRLFTAVIIFLCIFVSHYYSSNMRAQTKKDVTMRLTSPNFENKESIPHHFTCQGKDTSPELQWDNVPEGTKSFVLIVDDPDAPDPKAPQTTWVHWVVFNMPADKRRLQAGENIPDNQLGVNDFENKTQKKYGGPCPPIGQHRYFFKLYALDTLLDVTHANKQKIEKAMKGHILATAELIGMYQKK